jgi:hypothetical protein
VLDSAHVATAKASPATARHLRLIVCFLVTAIRVSEAYVAGRTRKPTARASIRPDTAAVSP